MSKPDVFMPLYIGDYLAGTSRLSAEQHGAYLLLIMDYWMNGALPDDDVLLANIARLTPDAWSMHKHILMQFFIVSEGAWTHKRIEEELQKAQDKKTAAQEKAAKAAKARWEKEKNSKNDASSNATSITQAMHKECPSPSPSPSPSNKKTPPKSPKGDVLPDIPDFIDKNQFEAYLDIRKKIKAVNSPQAITALINRLRKYTNENPVIAKQILEESIINSWKTVYPLKEEIRPKAVANGDYQPPKLKPFNFDD
ncbi:MAG: YdaU family protein [Pseudomonadales bacterium]|nr:YdaU family protein [Pseudomonadales bacterium]